MNSKSLLAALQSSETFLELCEDAAASTKKAQSVAQTIQELPKAKRGEFWRLALQSLRDNAYQNPKAYGLACVFANAWMDENKGSSDAIPPASLIELVAEAHDGLFELHDVAEIQSDVTYVCERWYTEGRPGRERVIAQLVPTVILHSLQAEGNPSRAYSLRETLPMFDLDDDSSLALKKLLVQCFVSPAYLNSNHGRKFLAYTMGLSEELMLAAHDSLRNQLLQLRVVKSVKRNAAISNLARIYYSAWQGLRREKAKEGDEESEKWTRLLQTFEEDVIQQDFMRGSVFFQDETLAKTFLKILNTAFHDNKKDRSVDTMLARLYEPVIWRGLAAVNASVRRNAAVVLFNAFPLHDPEAKLEQISHSLSKQFDAVSSLLNDPCDDVRATSAEGTCRILAMFWETIPVQRSSKLLQQIVNELAHDRTSPNVRSAVVRSLAYMLDYPLAQPALKLALPHLKKHLNDKSAQVRLETSKLLLKVDSTAGFKFTDICSIGSVLVRLVADKNLPQITSILTELLAPSFFPLDVPSVEQLKRAKSLASINFEASQVFFSVIHKFVDVNKTVKLALLFGSFVRARMREVTDEATGESNEADELGDAVEEIRVAIESICVLWESVNKQIQGGEEFAAARQALDDCFSPDAFVLPLFEWTPFGEKHEGTVLRLCGMITPQRTKDGKQQTTGLERRLLRGIFLSAGDCGSELEKKVALGVKWGLTDRVLKELVRSLSIHVNREKDVKRKVDSRAAVRALNQVIMSLGSLSVKPSHMVGGQSTQNAAAPESDVGLDESESPLSVLKSNDALQALFDVSRSSVSCGVDLGEVDDITMCLTIMEMKLDMYHCLTTTEKRPSGLSRAMEWAANRVELLCSPSLNASSSGMGDILKRRKLGGEDDTTRSGGFHSTEEEDEQVTTSMEGAPLVGGMMQAILNLAADALFLGCDLSEAASYMIESCATASGGKFLDGLLKFGLGRMLLVFKLGNLSGERADEMLRLVYLTSTDVDVMDHLLMVLLQKNDLRQSLVQSVILRLFCEGETRLFSRRPIGLIKVLSITLEILVASVATGDADESLLVFANHFAREASSTKQDIVRKELLKASKLVKGKLLGDQLFNLACELDESQS